MFWAFWDTCQELCPSRKLTGESWGVTLILLAKALWLSFFFMCRRQEVQRSSAMCEWDSSKRRSSRSTQRLDSKLYQTWSPNYSHFCRHGKAQTMARPWRSIVLEKSEKLPKLNCKNWILQSWKDKLLDTGNLLVNENATVHRMMWVTSSDHWRFFSLV